MSVSAAKGYNADGLAVGIERLLAVINTGNGPEIAAALTDVDGLAAAVGSGAPPRLRHFLAQRSYQKALEFLRESREPVNKPS